MSVASKTDILRARERSCGTHHGPDGIELRGGQSIVPRKSVDFVDCGAGTGGVSEGGRGHRGKLSMARDNYPPEHFYMAIPLGLDCGAGSSVAPRHHVFYLVLNRLLELVPYPKNALNTILPTSVILFAVELVLALLFSLDWASIFVNAVVTLSVASVPLILYLLKERSEKRSKQTAAHELTGEGILKLAQTERDRIDSAAQHLRSEERAFIQRQLNRTNALETLSRKRSHLFANAFSGIEIANTQLIALLEANKINVPPALKPTHLRESLWKKLDELVEQESGIAEMMVRDDPPPTTDR